MLRIGAHQTISQGFDQALVKVHKIGGNTLQIFSSSPRLWAIPDISADTIKRFLNVKKKLKIHPVYFHACYLLNLADPGRIGEFSVHSLIKELAYAAKMGIQGTIVHLGSFKHQHNFTTLLTNIKEILEKSPPSTLFIIENAATRKIGQTLEEIAEIIRALNNDRVRVCLDTCHLHAAGYILSSSTDFATFLKKFDNLIGIEKLEIIHANDSKDPPGSLRDRHENIGEGQVGLEVFRNFLTHPSTCRLPFIIETPGFDKKIPDEENFRRLKSLI